MPDPVLAAIAAALAGKAAAAVAAGGTAAVRALVELVRGRFTDDPEVLAALEAGEDDGDTGGGETIRVALERAAEEDPEFGEELRELWNRAGDELHADHGGVVNQVSGTVSGHVVQARDVTGGISFGGVPRSDQ